MFGEGYFSKELFQSIKNAEAGNAHLKKEGGSITHGLPPVLTGLVSVVLKMGKKLLRAELQLIPIKKFLYRQELKAISDKVSII